MSPRARGKPEPRPAARRAWILAIDTATSTVVLAAGSLDGRLLAVEAFPAEQRHSERLLPALDRLVMASGLERRDLAAIVAGIGPGAFTGLRVGLATAKTLAHELGVPIVPVSTAEALLDAAGQAVDGGLPVRLWLPAGPHQRLATEPGQETRLERDLPPSSETMMEIAVDLDGRAPQVALDLGAVALRGLPAALLRIGAKRLEQGETTDPEHVVPLYVTPPRGMAERQDPDAELAWSRGPR